MWSVPEGEECAVGGVLCMHLSGHVVCSVVRVLGFLVDLLLDVLSFIDSGVVKSPAVMGLPPASPFSPVHVCLRYVGVDIFITVDSSWWIGPLSLYNVFLCLL